MNRTKKCNTILTNRIAKKKFENLGTKLWSLKTTYFYFYFQ